MFPTKTLSSQDELIVTCPVKRVIRLLIHSQQHMVQSLKLGFSKWYNPTLGMVKWFDPAFNNGCNDLFMFELKLIHNPYINIYVEHKLWCRCAFWCQNNVRPVMGTAMILKLHMFSMQFLWLSVIVIDHCDVMTSIKCLIRCCERRRWSYIHLAVYSNCVAHAYICVIRFNHLFLIRHILLYIGTTEI